MISMAVGVCGESHHGAVETDQVRERNPRNTGKEDLCGAEGERGILWPGGLGVW